MKKFIQFEEKLNNFLIKLTDKVNSKLVKYAPQPYFDMRNKLREKKREIQEKFKKIINDLIEKFKEKVVKPAVEFNYLEFFNQKKEFVLNYIKEKKSEVFSKTYWKEKLLKFKNQAIEKIKRFNFLFLFKIVGGVALVYFLSIFLYDQFLNYLDYRNEQREIRYHEKELKPGHPQYYNQQKRTVNFYQILMPVYDENDFVRTVLLTFTVRGSNSYIALYLMENEIEVRNQLVSNIRIMDTKFLFTLEGKRVIKDKVKLELNKFLKKKQIRGEIEAVYVNELLTD